MELRDLHWMVDLYGSIPQDAENIGNLQRLLLSLNRDLFGYRGIVQITPVLGNTGKTENNGISGVIVANSAHFTIHTFSQRRVAFVDLFEEVDSTEEQQKRRGMILAAIKEHLGYVRADLRQNNDGDGFGRHVILQTEHVSLLQAINLVDIVLAKIDMTPLADLIITMNGGNHDILQPITESHIAVHSRVRTHHTTIDVFSCKPFDIDVLLQAISPHINISKANVIDISRGVRMENRQL